MAGLDMHDLALAEGPLGVGLEVDLLAENA
jgi:hypothetical protein